MHRTSRAGPLSWRVVAHRAPSRQLPVDGLWIFGAWLVGALVFFREQWDSSFKWLTGNDGDARLAAYLCEHWFQVLHGQASWLNPSFFYPVKGVLGWSDTFFLYEVFYAPLRLLGADPFLALQLTIILFSLMGFVTFVYLVRLGFGTRLPAAVACGLIFTFSNALWIHAGSPQLSGIYLVPAVLLIALLSWRAARAGRRLRAGALAGTAGLLWGLVLYSTYYIGWFSTLAVGVVLVRPPSDWRKVLHRTSGLGSEPGRARDRQRMHRPDHRLDSLRAHLPPCSACE